MRCGIGFHKTVARHAAFEQAVVFLRRFARYLQFYLKHQLGAFVGGFHRFGRELRFCGDEFDFRWENRIDTVEFDACFVVYFQTADAVGRQKDVHGDIGRIEQAGHFRAGGHHIADFGDGVFHPSVYRRADVHVVVGGRRRFDGRFRLTHACPCFGGCGTALRHGGLRFRTGGFGSLHGGSRAFVIGPAAGGFGFRHQLLRQQVAGIVPFHFRHALLLPCGFDVGFGAGDGTACLLFRRFGPLHAFTLPVGGGARFFHAAAAGVGREFGQYVARFHIRPFFHIHFFYPSGIQGGHVDAVQLQPAVGLRDKCGQGGGLLLSVIEITARRNGGNQRGYKDFLF